MQGIFRYGDIQNINLTSDKELNILTIQYNAFPHHHLQELQTFENCPAFWPIPCIGSCYTSWVGGLTGVIGLITACY